MRVPLPAARITMLIALFNIRVLTALRTKLNRFTLKNYIFFIVKWTEDKLFNNGLSPLTKAPFSTIVTPFVCRKLRQYTFIKRQVDVFALISINE
ncbi:hypothetical protein ACLK19_25115 [Escherichia coli]